VAILLSWLYVVSPSLYSGVSLDHLAAPTQAECMTAMLEIEGEYGKHVMMDI